MKNTWLKLIVIMLLAIATGLVLAIFAKSVQHLIAVRYTSGLEILIVTGQLVFQCIFVMRNGFEKLVNYWLNVILVSFTGALFLIPLIALDSVYAFKEWILLGYFFSVVLLMFFDHRRRIKKLSLPGYLSYSWVLYRCIILLLIL